jgi:Tol biopolymer transport system component
MKLIIKLFQLKSAFKIVLVILLCSFSFVGFAQHNYTEPAISPNGKYLVYCSDKSSKNAIYISNADGSNEKLFIDLEGYESTPNWSPNGEKICFYVMDDKGGAEMYVINNDGSNLINLSNGELKEPESTSWVSNNEIVFSSGSFPKKDIYLINVNTKELKQLTDLDGINYYAHLKKGMIVFSKFSRSKKGIFLMDLKSNELRHLTEQGEAPVLNKKASKIIYQGKSNKEAATGLRIIDLKTNQNTALTSNNELSELPDIDYKNNFVFYQRKINDHFSIWRINIDGTGNKKIIGN